MLFNQGLASKRGILCLVVLGCAVSACSNGSAKKRDALVQDRRVDARIQAGEPAADKRAQDERAKQAERDRQNQKAKEAPVQPVTPIGSAGDNSTTDKDKKKDDTATGSGTESGNKDSKAKADTTAAAPAPTSTNDRASTNAMGDAMKYGALSFGQFAPLALLMKMMGLGGDGKNASTDATKPTVDLRDGRGSGSGSGGGTSTLAVLPESSSSRSGRGAEILAGPPSEEELAAAKAASPYKSPDNPSAGGLGNTHSGIIQTQLNRWKEALAKLKAQTPQVSSSPNAIPVENTPVSSAAFNISDFVAQWTKPETAELTARHDVDTGDESQLNGGLGKFPNSSTSFYKNLRDAQESNAKAQEILSGIKSE